MPTRNVRVSASRNRKNPGRGTVAYIGEITKPNGNARGEVIATCGHDGHPSKAVAKACARATAVKLGYTVFD